MLLVSHAIFYQWTRIRNNCVYILIFKLYNFLWTVWMKKNPQNIHKFEKFCIIKMFVSIFSIVLLPVLAHVCITFWGYFVLFTILWFAWNLIKLYYKQLFFLGFFHIWTILLERIQIYTDLFERDHTEKAYNIKKKNKV